MNIINGINGVSGVGSVSQTTLPSTANQIKADTSFKDVLENLINQANETDASDQQSNLNLMTGDVSNLHDVIISGEEADLSLRLAVQVRNKVVDAYTEIMRMQV